MLPHKSPNNGPDPPEIVDLTQDANISNVFNTTITLDDSVSIKPGEVVTVSDSDSDIEATLEKPIKQMKLSRRDRSILHEQSPPPSLQSQEKNVPSTPPSPIQPMSSQSRSESPSSPPPRSLKSPRSSKSQVKRARDIAKRQKEEEKVKKEANRANAASRALDNCTANISKAVLDIVGDPEEIIIRTLFDESLIKYKLTDYPKVEDAITWTYKRTEVVDGLCTPTFTDSTWIAVLMKGDEYLRKILTYRNDPDNMQSIKHYLSDIRRRSKSDVVLMVYNLTSHLKSERMKEAKNYRKTFKDRFEGGQVSATPDEPACSSLGATELQDLRLMLEMEFKHAHPDWKLHIEFHEKTSDILGSIVRYTLSVARREVKQKARAATGLDWALSMDKDKPADPTKSSEDLTRLWISQLKQFSQVTVPIAKAIVSDYPSPYALLDQYENLTTTEAENLLAELYAQKNLRRQIGSNISKRIHRFMTCKDPNVHIGL